MTMERTGPPGMVAAFMEARQRAWRRRFAGGVVIAAACAGAGLPGAALAILAGMALTEAASARLARPVRAGRSASRGRTLLYMLTVMATATLHMLPAISLAAQPSLAITLAGFVWLAVGYVHGASSYVGDPRMSLPVLLPLLSGTALTLQAAVRTGVAPSSAPEWAVLGLVLAAFAVTTFLAVGGLARGRLAAEDRVRRLERLSREDPLTGLPNRRAFDEALAGMLARPGAHGRVAVMLIDLDDFKPLNDSYGHEAGDAMLSEIGRRLRVHADPLGVPARLGGDEFVVAMPDVASPEAARAFGTRLARAIADPFEVDGSRLRVSASVGVAVAAPLLDTVSALCAAADRAMYTAKTQMRARAVLHDATGAVETLKSQRERFLAAIDSGDIRPRYRPFVAVATGALVTAEAVPAWADAVREAALTERTIRDFGLRDRIFCATLGQVMDDIDAMLADGLDPGRITIEVTGNLLAVPGRVDKLAGRLEARPRVSGHLTLAIGEAPLRERSAEALAYVLGRFRKHGVRLALNDFGRGSLPMPALRHLRFDELRVAPDFAPGLGEDPDADELLGGLVSIARGLGAQVAVTGIETERQAESLRRLGCGIAEGPHFADPLDLSALRARLGPAELNCSCA